MSAETTARHGQFRSSGPSVQDLLNEDHHKVPGVLREESYQYTGSADIPTESFYRPEWHEREVRHLWRKVWQMACREEEIPEAGDHVLYEIGADSLIVVRTKAGQIKAFYNACLHRGRRLVDSDNRAAHFRCRYHGFSWNIDGTVREIPCGWDFTHIDPATFCLPEARVGTWGGFVFISMDPDGESLEEFLGPLPDHFADFPLEERYTELHVAKVLPANWKISLEAFIESFHVIATHPQALPRIGATNTQYDNYGEQFNFNRMISPKGIPSPYLGREVSPEKIIGSSKSEISEIAMELLSRGCSPRAALAEAERRHISALTDVDLSDKSDCEIIDTIQYFLFPNFFPWADYGNPFVYRFRPNGNDAATSIMDFYLLRPIGPKGRPGRAGTIHLDINQAWDEAPGLPTSLAFILNQDTGNLLGVQRGLQTTRKAGMTLGNYQESRIRHFHNLLDRWLSVPGNQ